MTSKQELSAQLLGPMEFEEKKAKSPWSSIYVACLLAFSIDIQFSLYFSSLWTYLQTLEASVTENFFGYVLGVYSFGQIVGPPLVGWWSNRIENIRIPLVACVFLSLVGNLVYLAAPTFPEVQRKYAVLGARFTLGCGASAIGLLRSYVATASTKADRTRAIAFITGGSALGMTTGPAFQLFFTPLAYPGLKVAGDVLLNMYTAPAFAGVLMNLVGIAVVCFFFREVYAGLLEKPEQKRDGEFSAVQVPDYDKTAAGVCYATRFTQMFTFTNLETLGAPLAMSMFALSKTEVVQYLAITHSALSGMSLCIYVFFIIFKLERYINVRRHCIVALSGLFVFHLVSFSWPFLPNPLVTYTEADLLNGTNGLEVVGCNRDRFSWCEDVRQVNVLVYFVSFALFIGIAFPNINLTNATLFSHILGPCRQATQQGVMQMSGSVARLIGPVVISSLYSSYGPRLAWILEMGILGATIGLWLAFYNRMVPMEVVNLTKPPTSPPSYRSVADCMEDVDELGEKE